MKLTKNFYASLLILLTVSFSGQASTIPVAGKQFIPLAKEIKDAPPVVEFFSFYCPACSKFNSPYKVSQKIQKKLPAGVKVEKFHTDFMGKMGKELTEAWSIAKALGIEDKIEEALFEAVLEKHSIETENDIKTVFVKSGIEPDTYDAAKRSFIVKSLTERQQKAALEFNISGTPSFYINGKYLIKNNGIKDTSIDGYGEEFANVVLQLLKVSH
ncbi:protein disulfide oxidoreductase DsbA [Salmonella enterica subsp. enterica serovar Richmond]|uniref:DsbA family protein n=1 Tax=Salmonella enterica TaxID=28901 RepID=UPI000DFF086D|nr:protein disulfide oxidoreductase DsbA [Salmonella enterica subsp. enterica serovar Richmond]EAA2047779.1 protein disulfide oxidoreductase DsbA [Salmonella enterica subsp. enterica serovar Chester]EAB8019182.1 protein disulfide oxidoreductase DsbA [Salmonella enterica subsp. enterica serovar Newport]EAC1168476.1 protein disulfide oxidoreductase DsbA [Salmonella enterica subsp. enterica serovar Typhimurium]EAP0133036.1 protein disulfide oxidoreductase DsbA [Salmonella enterica]EBH3089525.1 pr